MEQELVGVTFMSRFVIPPFFRFPKVYGLYRPGGSGAE